MATSYQIPDKLRQIWQSIKEPLQRTAETVDSAAAWPLEDVAGPGLLSSALGATYPDKPEDAFMGGILNLAPGYIAANFRSPEQLQQLRKLMAEEMRSRGPVGQATDALSIPIEFAEASSLSPSPHLLSKFQYPSSIEKGVSLRPSRAEIIQGSPIRYSETPDPFEQILRGSWYHGLSDKAREKVIRMVRREDPILAREFGGMLSPDELALRGMNQFGPPISLHDIQSISNKLGEPAGVSLSVLPTKAKDFAKDHFGNPDEYIHRVLPQYGGSPTERTVNLMTPEGRGILNDAYDVVSNRFINKEFIDKEPYGLLDNLSDFMNRQADPNLDAAFDKYLNPKGNWTGRDIGEFNLALSQELQNMGKRGILYNPQRWNEYEMLMLDPKWALPVDYRMFEEYSKPAAKRSWRGFEGSATGDPGPASTATPGVRKGLSQIQEIMSQNKSRLGDIYNERPWTQRLNEENKRRLLEMIESPYREQIGNQLYNR